MKQLTMHSTLLCFPLIAAVTAAPHPQPPKWTDGAEDSGHGFVVSQNVSFEDVRTLHPKDSSIEWLHPAIDLEPHNDNSPRDLVARNNKDETLVWLGKTNIDYGCDASIRKTLTEAIHSLCSEGSCDSGSYYTRDVDWTDGGRLQETPIKVEINGRYRGRHTRGYLADAVAATVNPDTAKPYNKKYQQRQEGLTHQTGTMTRECNMSYFTNFIRVEHAYNGGENDGKEDWLEIKVSELETNAGKLSPKLLYPQSFAA